MGNPKGVRRDFEGLERRRLQAVALLEQGLGESKGLKQAGRAGRKPRLKAEELKRLEQGLLTGPEALGYETPLWTLWRVSHLIEQELGVRYHPGHVWKLLRQLQWSCQRPEGRARERNEQAIQHWKKVEWPGIKKKPKKRGAPDRKSTRAG